FRSSSAPPWSPPLFIYRGSCSRGRTTVRPYRTRSSRRVWRPPPRTLATFWPGTFDLLFMPTYPTSFRGWPASVQLASRIVAMALAVAWVVPGLRTESKAASFTLLGSVFYLSYFPPTPYPWYLCLPVLLGLVTLSGLLAQAFCATQKIASAAVARFI